MHNRGGAKRYFSDVSLIDVRRTFRDEQDHGQNPAERFLLAHHLQGRPPFLHGVPTMSGSIEHLQARWNADAANPLSGDFLSLRDRFYATFPTFWREYSNEDNLTRWEGLGTQADGELFWNMNTRVLSEPILLLLLIHSWAWKIIHLLNGWRRPL